jgi:hypothetical protein
MRLIIHIFGLEYVELCLVPICGRATCLGSYTRTVYSSAKWTAVISFLGCLVRGTR